MTNPTNPKRNTEHIYFLLMFESYTVNGHVLHDARIWNKSPLKEVLIELMECRNVRIDETYHILGDSAYPMSNYLITPYKTRGVKLNDQQNKLNTHLA